MACQKYLYTCNDFSFNLSSLASRVQRGDGLSGGGSVGRVCSLLAATAFLAAHGRQGRRGARKRGEGSGLPALGHGALGSKWRSCGAAHMAQRRR